MSTGKIKVKIVEYDDYIEENFSVYLDEGNGWRILCKCYNLKDAIKIVSSLNGDD